MEPCRTPKCTFLSSEHLTSRSILFTMREIVVKCPRQEVSRETSLLILVIRFLRRDRVKLTKIIMVTSNRFIAFTTSSRIA